MIQNIYQKANYSIAIDLQKQRAYITLTGQWEEQLTAEEYLRDLRAVLTNFEGAFSLVADFSKMLPFKYSLEDNVHLKALRILISSGLKKSAEVMPENERAHQQLITLSEIAKAPLNLFGERSIAEDFLDTYMAMSPK